MKKIKDIFLNFSNIFKIFIESINNSKLNIGMSFILTSFSFLFLKILYKFNIHYFDTNIKDFYEGLVPYKLILLMIIILTVLSVIIKFIFVKLDIQYMFIIKCVSLYSKFTNDFIGIYMGMMLAGTIFSNNDITIFFALSLGVIFYFITSLSQYILIDKKILK